MKLFLAIAAGGALRSLILGGLIETLALAWSPSVAIRGFLAVGVLGAITTLSALSMDFLLLYERGEWAAALYIMASVTLSLAGLVFGLRLIRLVLA